MKLIQTMFAVGVVLLLAGYHFNKDVPLELMGCAYLLVGIVLSAQYAHQVQNDRKMSYLRSRYYNPE